MAISLKFSVSKSSDCKTLTFTDNTCTYSLVNLGGWGDPNHALSTALTATITIAKRNLDGTWTNSPFSPVNVFPTLPSNIRGSVNVTAQQFGYGINNTFADGVYRFTYTVTGSDSGSYTLTKVIYEALTCAIDCCYQKVVLKSVTCSPCCEDIDKQDAKIAFYHRLLKSAEDCGNLELIQKYIDLLTSICANCGQCFGCNSDCGCGC